MCVCIFGKGGIVVVDIGAINDDCISSAARRNKRENFVSYSYIHIYIYEGGFFFVWMVSGAFEEAFVVKATTLFTKSEIIYLYLFGYVSLILINFVCLYVLVRCSSNI